jgi:hypothetical protein
MMSGLTALLSGLLEQGRKFMTSDSSALLKAKRLPVPHVLMRPRDIGSVFLASVVVVVTLRILIELMPGYLNIPSENLGYIGTFYHEHDKILGTSLRETIGLLRRPLLLLLGVILPLIVFLLNWHNHIYVKCLNPYFLLIGAQSVVLYIANSLLGDGATTFVGIIFSCLRVLQLFSLGRWLTQVMDELPREGTSKTPLCLLLCLTIVEVVLWTLNAIYLGVFVFNVSTGLLRLGLMWHWK